MSDAPDYEHVINTEASALSDAPDWQDVAVEPGGGPIGGGGSASMPLAAQDMGFAAWSYPYWQVTTRGYNTTETSYPIGSLMKAVTTTTVSDLWVCNYSAGVTLGITWPFCVYLITLSGMAIDTITLLGYQDSTATNEISTVAGFSSMPFITPFDVTAGQLLYAVFNFTDNSGNWTALGYTTDHSPATPVPPAWLSTTQQTVDPPISSYPPDELGLLNYWAWAGLS